MEYITETQLAGALPKGFLQQAITDSEASGMTAAEVWDEITENISDAIHGALAPKYTPPYPEGDAVLYTVRAAARVIGKKVVFERRRVYDEALWKEVEETIKNLRKIGQGVDRAPSAPNPPARRTVVTISEPAKFSRQ